MGFPGFTFIAQQGGPQSFLLSFLPIILVFVIFYMLIFLPMRRRQRKLEQLIANLKQGDKVITSGGIYGTVAAVKDRTVLLKVADQVRIEIAKNAIAGLQQPEEEKK